MSWRWPLCALLVGCASVGEDVTRTDLAVTSPDYALEITPGFDVDEAFLRREVSAAIALYRRDVAEPTAPVSVVVDAPDCLRTGYDMPTKKVLFCNNGDTPRAGTASADVIHHEVFHALLCQTKPAWCDPSAAAGSEATALHEGLADFFAYVLAPDDLFGEGFYRDQAFVRRYRVPYCYSLVGGGHEKGNAIVSELIARGAEAKRAWGLGRSPIERERGHGLADVAHLVTSDALTLGALFGAIEDDSCFGAHPPQIERTVTGYPVSTLERYRIRPDAPLSLDFAGDAAYQRRYPNLTIRWEPAPTLFAVTNVDPRSFRIAVTGADGYEKVTALYVVNEGGHDEVVGGKNFYFQVAQP